MNAITRACLSAIAGILLAATIFPACTTSRSTGFSRDQIAGVVYAEDGTPVVGAEITVDRIRRGVSDAFGRFRIAGVPAGTRTVTVTAEGYESAYTTLPVENRTQLVRVDLVSYAGLAERAIAAIEEEHWDRVASILVRMEAVDPDDARTVLVRRIREASP